MVGRRPQATACALPALFLWLVVFEGNELLGLRPMQGLLLGAPSHLVVDYGAGIVCLLGAMRRGGADRASWLLIAAGILSWAAGDTYWTFGLLDHESIPVPSLADLGYLAFPVLVFAGVARLGRARLHASTCRLWIDAASAALATAAIAAAVVVPMVMDTLGGSWAETATSVAYPLSDLILLGLVVGAVAVNGWRVDGQWALVGLGIVAFWIADSRYVYEVAKGYSSELGPWDVGWDVAFLALAGAGSFPARAAQVRQGASRRTGVLPLVFAASALGVLFYAGIAAVTPVAVILAALAVIMAGVRLWMAFRDHAQVLDVIRQEALTDSLTGLGNRRALMRDLDDAMAGGRVDDELVLVLFDLDGFKQYNDIYGHPAGDELLVRLGTSLMRQIAPRGRAYRMGGDEFCALLPPDGRRPEVLAAQAVAALRERGEGFDVGASHGVVVVPAETADPSQALRLADQRMYSTKHRGRRSEGTQSRDVLLRALAEREPERGEHRSLVSELAATVARGLGLEGREVESVRQAADLHDVGKVGIPDAILNKPGPLDDEEWAFMRRHTIIGERILGAAPALRDVAAIVRSTHEHFDGGGYPDGLCGEQIPLGARIITVCDAYHGMVAGRPYRSPVTAEAALTELERCAGTQFDPRVVAAFLVAHEGLVTPGAGLRATAA